MNKEVEAKRILRVPKDFGKKGSVSDYQHEQALEALFRLFGYKTRRSGSFNWQNPLEIGFYQLYTNKKEVSQALAQAAGVAMPAQFSVDQLLSTEAAVVAKHSYSSGGKNKFLLESSQQKAAFLAWSQLYPQLRYGKAPSDEEIAQTIAQIEESGATSNPQTRFWNLEQFIHTPGDFDSSFRIVVDAFGQIHYSSISKAAHPKRSQLLQMAKVDNPVQFFQRSAVPLAWLLTQPDSPFFLGTYQIVSNVAQSGQRILLNGTAQTNSDNRKLLTDLQIDPDHPTLPEPLIQPATIIGQQCRPFYPHVGVDFIQSAGLRQYYFLEANGSPSLAAEPLGLADDSSQARRELRLIFQTLSSIT